MLPYDNDLTKPRHPQSHDAGSGFSNDGVCLNFSSAKVKVRCVVLFVAWDYIVVKQGDMYTWLKQLDKFIFVMKTLFCILFSVFLKPFFCFFFVQKMFFLNIWIIYLNNDNNLIAWYLINNNSALCWFIPQICFCSFNNYLYFCGRKIKCIILVMNNMSQKILLLDWFVLGSFQTFLSSLFEDVHRLVRHWHLHIVQCLHLTFR